MPLGGLTLANMASYLADPLIAGIGGSWLAPREAIGNGQWSLIRDAATQAIAIRDQVRPRK